MTRIKICGITNSEDARAAIQAGADALGFNFYEPSPRYLTPETCADIVSKMPPFVSPIGIFVNESVERVNAIASSCELSAVQLHGDESPEYCEKVDGKIIKAIRVRDDSWQQDMEEYPVAAVLLDTYTPDKYGGTGTTFDWNLIGTSASRIILSGGLDPQNVSPAVQSIRPFGVDTSSGVERQPGLKDHEKIRQFVTAVRRADLEI